MNSAVIATSCQVYPSEYAFHQDSVNGAESPSANCKNYRRGIYHQAHTEDFIYYNGTQLTLSDSNLGSQQYNPSDYYERPSGLMSSQLLFIFPTRVKLTTITLHYYSDSDRGLPDLRFFDVPDNFNVWKVPMPSYSHRDITKMLPGITAGNSSVSINVDFYTRKVLITRKSSTFYFVVSEVEFFHMCR